MDKKVEERKEKIKAWLKDPCNLMLAGLFAFIIVYRLYYFILTKNQPLWWDEAEYMSAAKSYAGISNYRLSFIRLPLFPLIMSLFFRIGITSEPIIRFFGLIIPSLIVIFLVYFVLSNMYDKKIGIISALILTVLWEHVFYSNRFHTENLALIFEFFAIYFIIMFYDKNNEWKTWNKVAIIGLVIVMCVFSVLARLGNMIFVPAIFGFLILYGIVCLNINEKTKNWLIATLLIALPIGYYVLTRIIIPNVQMLSTYYHPEKTIAWNSLTVFNGFYLNSFPAIILWFAFLLGVLLVIVNCLLSYDEVFKKLFLEKRDFAFDILNFMIIISVMFAMIFMLRTNEFEYRWFFPLLPGMLAFTSKGIVSFSNFIEKNLKIKHISFALTVIILFLGIYPQIIHTNNLVKIKAESYQQVKDSGLWLRENSEKNDIIVSASIPQHSYYSERKVVGFYENSTNKGDEKEFERIFEKYKPKYLVLSVFEPAFTPKWAYELPIKYNQTLIPVKVYTMQTQQGERAVLIVYEIKQDSFYSNIKL